MARARTLLGGLALLLASLAAAALAAAASDPAAANSSTCDASATGACSAEEEAETSLLQSRLSTAPKLAAIAQHGAGAAAATKSEGRSVGAVLAHGVEATSLGLSDLLGGDDLTDRQGDRADTGSHLSPLLLLAGLCVPLLLGTLSHDYARYAAEFLGTFTLVFTVICCVVVGSGTWNALAIACVLMVMIYATGPVSGGNLNPAVSFALGLVGEMEWSMVFKYWLAQLSAGFSAAACADSIFSFKVLTLAPVKPFLAQHALFAEMVYTFMLVFVVLNTAVSKRNNSPTDGNQFFGLAIGFVIVAGGYAVGGISGAAFNPAVALGVDYQNFGAGWTLPYAVAELAGAALAVAMYKAVRPEEATADPRGSYTARGTTKLLSEFLGTFMLVLTVGLNVVGASPAVALSAAAALMCMVYSLGDVSGAHFNPAVTVALVVRGACGPAEGLAYIATQLISGVCAGAATAFFHAGSAHKDVTISVKPGANYTFFQGAICELFFTFVLAYTVLAVATTKKPLSQTTSQKFYFALSIAACVVAGGFAVGSVSGGELNPAVALGLTVLGAVSPGETAAAPLRIVLGFCAIECMGGILAAMTFYITHPRERNEQADEGVAALACEFVGTFVLVFTVACCVLCGGGTFNATAIAFVLMAMVYSVGGVSGGHLNPAVSFALGLAGFNEDFTWSKVLKYTIAQLSAGAVAGAAACALFAPKAVSLAPVAPFNAVSAAALEVVYTFMLCFVVLNCACSRVNNPSSDGNQSHGLAIGFVIIAGGYASGNVSGGALNPAVALGLDIKNFGLAWGPVWMLAELCGAALAVVLFRLVRPDEGLNSEDAARYTRPLVTKCASEFLGTFMLVLTVGLNIVTGSVATAWSAAAALMCMIYSLGSVSGAHFNPAVTVAIMLSGRGKCSPADGASYMVAQCLAGTVAGLLCTIFHDAGPKSKVEFHVRPVADFSAASAGTVEMFFTFVLAYVVLAVATTRPPASQLTTRHSFPFALAIGSCVTAGGLAAGAISGGALNPAVAIGLAAQDLSMGLSPAFACWQLAGGVLASVALRATHPLEFQVEAVK